MVTDESSTVESSQLRDADPQQRLIVGLKWVFPETRSRRVSGGAEVVGREQGFATLRVGSCCVGGRVQTEACFA